MDSGGYAGAQVTADSGSAYQKDFGLELIDDSYQCLGVRLGPVVFQSGIIHNDDSVSAVAGKSLYQTADFRTDEYCCDFLCFQAGCQFFRFAEKLQCDRCDLIVYLLSEDKYSFIFF